MYKDQLSRFLFEDLGVRGEIVSLDKSFQTAISNHNYPATVAKQLGEALAASLLLSATLKFDGSLIMQIRGNGPISMLVAQANDQQAVRGLAHWDGVVPEGSLTSQFGDGVLVMTIKPTHGKAYQGVVSLEGDCLADALHAYFAQSEQLKTRLWFAVDNERVVGLMLQELPEHDGKATDWQRVELLANTITDTELLTLDAETIIHRLFHEESVRLYDPKPVSFTCDCSRKKVENSLLTLGLEELRSLIEEKGVIEADCDFCNKHYQFDSIDIEQLFTDKTAPSSTTQH